MFPQAAPSVVSNKGNRAKREAPATYLPPTCLNTTGSGNNPKPGSQFVWIRSHSGEVLSGRVQAPLLLSNAAAVARSPVLPLEPGKICVCPPFGSGISLFPTPATSFQNHIPSTDMTGMELNSASNSTPFFCFTQDNGYNGTKSLKNICRSWKSCLQQLTHFQGIGEIKL